MPGSDVAWVRMIENDRCDRQCGTSSLKNSPDSASRRTEGSAVFGGAWGLGSHVSGDWARPTEDENHRLRPRRPRGSRGGCRPGSPHARGTEPARRRNDRRLTVPQVRVRKLPTSNILKSRSCPVDFSRSASICRRLSCYLPSRRPCNRVVGRPHRKAHIDSMGAGPDDLGWPDRVRSTGRVAQRQEATPYGFN